MKVSVRVEVSVSVSVRARVREPAHAGRDEDGRGNEAGPRDCREHAPLAAALGVGLIEALREGTSVEDVRVPGQGGGVNRVRDRVRGIGLGIG